jgi:hypothetical protein
MAINLMHITIGNTITVQSQQWQQHLTDSKECKGTHAATDSVQQQGMLLAHWATASDTLTQAGTA